MLGGVLVTVVGLKLVSPLGVAGVDGPVAGPTRIILGESTPRLNLTDIPRGGRREVPFVLSNPGPAAVTLGPVRTSCDCLTVTLDADRIEAGAEIGGRAIVNFADEPTFAGGLMLNRVPPQ